ncbi:MAG: hypothetical protein ACFCD0_22145 [Gemmataceae bacterium]
MRSFIEQQIQNTRRKLALGTGAFLLLVILFLGGGTIIWLVSPDVHSADIFIPLGYYVGIYSIGFFLVGGRLLIRIVYPNSHPLLKAISEVGDLDTVWNTIESEQAQALYVGNNELLTDNWMIQFRRGKWRVNNLEEILWVYRDYAPIQRTSMSKRSPHVLYLYSETGVRFEIRNSAQVIEETMELLQDRVPNAFFGFDELLEELWDEDRQEFAAKIELRVSRRRRRAESMPQAHARLIESEDGDSVSERFSELDR